MEDHNTPDMSESEQMYLLTLAMLAEDGMTPPVPLAALAHARAVQPVSVNQMIRKLADANLVTYLPYKGVELTPAGQAVALRVLRYRRLWEVFLVEKLGMPADAADTLACRLEHLTSDEVAGRLARFLGEPRLSPQGKPIPCGDATIANPEWLPLPNAPTGRSLRVIRLNVDTNAVAFLGAQGIRPGVELKLLAAGPTGEVLVCHAGQTLRLAAELAAHLLVRHEKG